MYEINYYLHNNKIKFLQHILLLTLFYLLAFSLYLSFKKHEALLLHYLKGGLNKKKVIFN